MGNKFRMPPWSAFSDFLALDGKHFFFPGCLCFLLLRYFEYAYTAHRVMSLLAECEPSFEVIVEWFRVCWNVKFGRVFLISFLYDSYLYKYIDSSNSKNLCKLPFLTILKMFL